jgi:hypothetical protein
MRSFFFLSLVYIIYPGLNVGWNVFSHGSCWFRIPSRGFNNKKTVLTVLNILFGLFSTWSLRQRGWRGGMTLGVKSI